MSDNTTAKFGWRPTLRNDWACIGLYHSDKLKTSHKKWITCFMHMKLSSVSAALCLLWSLN